MVNSRINSLKFTRIFNKNLHSTDVFDTQKSFRQITSKFDMNPGEKQAEIYTYEAPWLIYACNWSVRRLRSFSLYVYRSLYRSFSLSNSLCLCDGIPIGSRSLFSLGDPNYIHEMLLCLLYLLYVLDHSCAFQLTPTCSSFLSLLLCDKHNKHDDNTKGSKR